MSAAVSPHEESQLAQTIEMFEVITQSQPLDYQSLEILKEAYLKLGRQTEVLSTSKRIASACVQLGQLSSAILEYETILQSHPDDPDVKTALAEIEQRATTFALPHQPAEPEPVEIALPRPTSNGKSNGKVAHVQVEDGREIMYQIFVTGKLVGAVDFESCWPEAGPDRFTISTPDPFILTLEQRQLVSMEKSLKLICERARTGYLSVDKYDVDVDLARGFSKDVCQRWCILPFDRMSKSLLVATANPFNKQAARDLEQQTKNHVIWYLTQPAELVRMVRKLYR